MIVVAQLSPLAIGAVVVGALALVAAWVVYRRPLCPNRCGAGYVVPIRGVRTDVTADDPRKFCLSCGTEFVP